ncbi:DDE superfamily endonuclease [Popillia japonica]|uniref:DDE superfamily endonuclease n=1 Tax=Popillia japonica TaxID=7064 RepID=A0AAW1LAW0_POPJA
MIVRSVCRAIRLTMKAEMLPLPTKEQWESIAAGFERKANFPHCLGAVDGKHIRLVCPFKSGSMYYNYKQYFSVVLMAIADSEYRFVYVDIGSYGKDCDSSVFQRSRLWRSIENENIELPTEKCLPGAMGPQLPHVFIADEAFGLHRNLLRPLTFKFNLTLS